MDISRYRARHDLDRKQFGALIGVTAEFVRLCEKGRRKLSPEKSIQLEEATGGEIARHETRPDLWEAPAEAS